MSFFVLATRFYSYYGYGSNDYYLFTVLIFIAIGLCMLASAGVSSSFKKYSKVRAACGLCGAEVAERILHSNGIYDVSIGMVGGKGLSDHYDPRNKSLSLSESVYRGSSIASICVAAHECGHAIQHAHNYVPLTIRSAIVPAVNVANRICWPLILVGFLVSRYGGLYLVYGGIILFAITVAFQVITLPVEFDASHKALKQLTNLHILSDAEVSKGRKVLVAAAMTYVTAALLSILQLLRLISSAKNRR